MPPHESGKRQIETNIWANMRVFVQTNEHHGNLRERLNLGLGTGRLKALLLLKDGPMSLRGLATAHGVDAPYATVIVDRLQTLGYVDRTVDPTDHRRKLVALTAAGGAAAALTEETLTAPPPALEELSTAELATLDELLLRLLTNQSPKEHP